MSNYLKVLKFKGDTADTFDYWIVPHNLLVYIFHFSNSTNEGYYVRIQMGVGAQDNFYNVYKTSDIDDAKSVVDFIIKEFLNNPFRILEFDNVAERYEKEGAIK